MLQNINSNRRMNVGLNLAAAAGGAAARVAVDRALNWLSSPGPAPANPNRRRRRQAQTMDLAPLQQALPSNAIARGAGRRARGRGRGRGRGRQAGQPPAGLSMRSGMDLVVRDTEVLGNVKEGMAYYLFNPAPAELVRLKQQEVMYRRYRIKYMNIAYKSLSGIATAGSVCVGVLVGTKDTNVKDAASVQKLKPMFSVPAWKNDTLSVGSQIDMSRYMSCGDETLDGVSFTLYVYATTKDLGLISVSYEVEFSYPRPF